MSSDHKYCGCEACATKHDFVLPKELLEALTKGKLVLFVGAGASTETPLVLKRTFYSEVREDLGLDGQDISFSELMSKYCSQPDGRKKLINRIRDRFDYIRSFPEIFRNASRFHRELSSIFLITEIFTTNWDDYFETECGAIPLVTSSDFIFWDAPGRKVFKLHGSINNYGSIIATTEDYEKCYKTLSEGLLGSYLKLALATKTVVFIGYSFQDEDFTKIYNFLKDEMRELLPHSYIVTLDEKAPEKFAGMNVTPVITDATHFITTLKDHLIQSSCILPDKTLTDAVAMYLNLVDLHEALLAEFNIKEYPNMVYTACYQDGLIHAFERMRARMKTGEYSHKCGIIWVIEKYLDMRQSKVRHKNFTDVAYIDGYLEGLMYLITDDENRASFSPFYIYGYKENIFSLEDFRTLITSNTVYHKTAFKAATELVATIHDGVVFHHRPAL